jgi:hypothetical protein
LENPEIIDVSLNKSDAIIPPLSIIVILVRIDPDKYIPKDMNRIENKPNNKFFDLIIYKVENRKINK